MEKCFAIMYQIYPLMEKSETIMRILFFDRDKHIAILDIIFSMEDKDNAME